MSNETFDSTAESATMNNRFSPSGLFFLLNLMIATILISSKLSRRNSSRHSHHDSEEQDDHHHQQEQEHEYEHVYEHEHERERGGGGGGGRREEEEEHNPLHHYPAPPTELPSRPPSRPPSRLGRFERPPSRLGKSEPPRPQQQTSGTEHGHETEHEGAEMSEADDGQSYENIYMNIKRRDARRSRGGWPEAPGSPRLRRSWSVRSDSGRSVSSAGGGEEEEDGEAVERRRPASAREWKEGDEEVDARADDFINRFKQQLRLQRLESFSRYRAMIGLSGRNK